MKDQYVGDVGDYSKYGLLRFLLSKGYSLGVNWYLTSNDRSGDGGHTEYLNSCEKQPDPELFCLLRNIIRYGDRKVSAIEESGLFAGAVFYNARISNLPESSPTRDEWHCNALKETEGCKIVFLDPDNGLGIKPRRRRYKIATYDEVFDYYGRGQNVVVYQRYPCKPKLEYDEQFPYLAHRFAKDDKFSSDQILVVSARRYSCTDFIFLMQPDDCVKLRELIVDDFLPQWNHAQRSAGYCSLCDLCDVDFGRNEKRIAKIYR